MKQYVYLLLGYMTFAAACGGNSSDKASVPAPAATQAPRVMAPFRFHKTIEVSPGQYYDVLAWGRGSESMGAFEILRSDSASMKYTTTTGDLEGRIVDVYNADMDTDGDPELFIHTQAADSTNAAEVFAFEYKDDNARKIDFPRLTRSQRKGYRGNDNFFIKDGNLMREFDVYDESDSLAKKPIQKRLIQYTLRGNSLSADQLSTDSVMKETAIAPVASRNQQTETQSGSKSSSVRKKSTSRRSVKRRTSSRKKQTTKKRRRHR
ncbi:hypothetical protein ABDD95_15925 [Mucilaginibacter sp. PAMB04274]|uniref:hypothetical protein n=1 Tax=Mucilaginibacter sp. PAMB04274 TaxID=3138568 RepID=UPI0031F6C079